MGIFALGTASHAYLELDLRDGADPCRLVACLADLREPPTTIGGVNLVVGLRPELWRDRIGGSSPADLHGFNEPVIGSDGFTMPATQHDALWWLARASYVVVFDEARGTVNRVSSSRTPSHPVMLTSMRASGS
ncbi:MAG: hypothetical protein ACJ8H8_32550 [Geminicoccaceae bacterium]